eukprot:3821435-Rhodomonas_salina.2
MDAESRCACAGMQQHPSAMQLAMGHQDGTAVFHTQEEMQDASHAAMQVSYLLPCLGGSSLPSSMLAERRMRAYQFL